MERKIIFRGKDKTTGEWFCGNLFDKNDRGETIICTLKKGSCNIDCETVGQYIGLDDRKGTPIYEGDIINIKLRSYHTSDIIVDTNCKVVFKNGCFGLADYGYRKEFTLFSSFVQSLVAFEVVGNIHDNPELITK